MPRTWVEINTEALAWNYSRLREKAGDVPLLAVVKANAYGHGVGPVSQTLFDLGMRWFGVASVEEGAALRKILPQAHILVLGYIPEEEIKELFAAELIPQISDLSFALALDALAQRQGRVQAVHVKVDTGMGRLGVLPADIEVFLQGMARLSHLRVEGLLSHLSSADEDDLAPSEDQSRLFEGLSKQVKAAGLPVQWFHLANSHAIFRMPGVPGNLMRSGLFLYGLYPNHAQRRDFDLRPVLSWKARVGTIKEYQPGQTISYGRTFTVRRPTRIAVIPVGYADGYSRSLSNRGKVLIRGDFAPIVGRITMDHLMVDVSAIPGVQEGDEAVLIGSQGAHRIGAEDLADWQGTISYEIVCGIGPRVIRTLIKEIAMVK